MPAFKCLTYATATVYATVIVLDNLFRRGDNRWVIIVGVARCDLHFSTGGRKKCDKNYQDERELSEFLHGSSV